MFEKIIGTNPAEQDRSELEKKAEEYRRFIEVNTQLQASDEEIAAARVALQKIEAQLAALPESEPVSEEEYAELRTELKQLYTQLSAAIADPDLPEDVTTGIRERIADVEGHIQKFENENPDRAIVDVDPEPVQEDLPLMPHQNPGPDEERFENPGTDSPAFLRNPK